MTETFYSVFGVGPDADRERIERAYRQAVKECHPDVCDDPAAAERFKRLTAARDVLVDEDERARYDRLGHAAYVRRHPDSPAWSVTADRSTSGSGTAADSETQAEERMARRASTASRAASTRSRPTGTRAACEPDSGVWNAQPAGAVYQRRGRAGPLDRIARVFADIGPWLVAHAAFLGLALWTAQHWLTTDYGITLPGLALIGLELLIAVAVSAVHLASVSTG